MPWPLRALAALARRLGPVEGWMSVAALSVALLALAWAVEDAAWTPAAPAGYAPVLLAVWLAIVLAKRVRQGWLAGAAAVLVGAAFSVLTAARAWPPGSVLDANLRYGLVALQDSHAQLNGIPLHDWVLEHLIRWAKSMQEVWTALQFGHKAPNDQPLVLVILLLLWFVAFWAGWAAYRYHGALLALAPAGAVIATNLFLALSGTVALMLYMGGLLMLAVALREYTLRRQWKEEHIDFSDELRLDLYLSGIGMAIVILTIPPLVPNLRLRNLQRAFWQVVQGPATTAESQVKIVFPALNRRQGSPLEEMIAAKDVLPRSHLLQSGPELSERIVMHVHTSDPVGESGGAGADYRWREVTYSIYNGRGWENPATATSHRHGAGEPWTELNAQGRRPLKQRFDFVASPGVWMVAAGEPIAAYHSYIAHLRNPGDAIGLEAQLDNYIVVSEVPAVSEDQLRANTAAPPEAIATAYLNLPPSVPPRVLSLAQAITDEAATPYDKANAIAAYLRRFPYSLDVPAPPPGVDVVDHFLFSLQRGYCDYYATAMVVLARAVGLPARLAVGYATGSYEPATGQYTVTEADAHSWPEVFFTNYGWIPFEPTASQPELMRQATTAPAGPALATELKALRREAWRQGVKRWSLPLIGLLALVWVGRQVGAEWRLRRQATNPWQLAYLRLERWGDRLGIPPAPWLTPREYAGRWRSWLETRPVSTSLAVEIGKLSEGLERRAYAPTAERPLDGEAHKSWRRLRGRLWQLRLVQIRRALKVRRISDKRHT